MANQDRNRLEAIVPDLMYNLNAVLVDHGLEDLRIAKIELVERDVFNGDLGNRENVNLDLDAANDAVGLAPGNIMIAAAIPPPPQAPPGCTARFSHRLNRWIIVCP